MNEYNNYNENGGGQFTSGVYRPDYARSLAATASVLGILAIASAVFMPFVVPSILGGMAIILAVISKGKDNRLSQTAKRGVTLGSIALVIHIAVMTAVGFTGYKMLTDPVLRDQANEITTKVYGYTFDDMLKILDDDLGTDLYEMDGSKRTDGDTTPIIPGINDTDALSVE